MKLSRSEVAFAIALATVAVLFGITHWVGVHYQEHQDTLDAEEMEHRNIAIAQGKTIVLDSKADAEPLPSGRTYAALDWEGALQVAMERAVAFRYAEEAWEYLGEDVPILLSRESIDDMEGFLIVKVKLKNIDAKNNAYDDPYEFNAAMFFPDDIAGDIVAFDSAIPEAEADGDLSKRTHFTLKPGGEKVVKIAYELRDWPPTDSVELHIGARFPEKYRFILDIEKDSSYDDSGNI